MREPLPSALRSHNGMCLYGTVLSVCYFPCRYVCKGECFESYVEVGEILYYGAGWSHETQNLVTPTVTITGTVVHEWNYNTVRTALRIAPRTRPRLRGVEVSHSLGCSNLAGGAEAPRRVRKL